MFDKRMGELESIKQAIIDTVRSNILDLLPVGTVMWFKQIPSINGRPLTNWVICEELIGRYPLGTEDASEVGNIVEAGLPNIYGGFQGTNGNIKGSFTDVSGGMIAQCNHGAYADKINIDFDASKGTVSSITYDDTGKVTQVEYLSQQDSPYGKSTTVTPPSVKLMPYIKIA